MNYFPPLRWSSTVRPPWRDDGRRIVGLDLLRAVAISSVVLFHYHLTKSLPLPFIRFGWIGVELFFVLSGYLIGGQLFSLHLKHRFLPLKTFYMRRFMRTLPNYYVVLALHLAIPALNPFKTFKEALVAMAQYVTFTQNLTLALPLFQISWSLCVEEHFYLLLPLAIVLILKREGKGRYWIFPLIILSQFIIRCAILVYGFHKYSLVTQLDVVSYMARIYYPTYAHLDGLTIGVALAALRHYRPKLWSSLMGFGNKLIIAGGISLAAAFLIMTREYYLLAGIVSFTLLGISFGLFTAAALSRQCLLSRVRLRGITLLAELAYSIYLTHLIAFYLAEQLLSRFGLSGRSGLSFFVTMLVVMVTAITLFLLVERPCLQLRDRMFKYEKIEMSNPANADISIHEVQSPRLSR